MFNRNKKNPTIEQKNTMEILIELLEQAPFDSTRVGVGVEYDLVSSAQSEKKKKK
jgi:hypothetical protein